MSTQRTAGHPERGRFSLRTLGLVTVLTLLVWLLAESRTVRAESVELTPSLELGTVGDVLTRAAEGTQWPDALAVTLSGSAAGLDQAIGALRGRFTLRVGIEVPAVPGVHDIDLREVIRASDVLVDAGVSVEEVDPPRVQIRVSALERIELPVRVVTPDSVAFEPSGRARAVPATVVVSGPAEVIARLEGAEAVVRLDARSIQGLVPGRAATISGLRVELPFDPDRWATRIEPPQADVAVTLRSRTAELTLSAMPVQVMLAPGEVGAWTITLEPGSQDLIGIQVVGPSDQIARLRDGDAIPTAFLSLGFDELERGVTSKPADLFGLPEGVRLAPGQSTEVRFRVTRRSPADEPGVPGAGG